MSEVVREVLTHGAALCAAMTAVILGSLKHNPRIWSHATPADVRAVLGPDDERTRRQRRAWGVVMIGGMLAILASLLVRLPAAVGGPPGFLLTAIAVYAWFQTFNHWDALVIDVGLVWLRPRFAFVPGTEDLPGLRSVRWHVVNYLKGLLAGVPFALAGAVIAQLLPGYR
ncbi:MAG: hypothetical protein M5U28_29150 [Sandaracinaceae bacterium]|nr:hypothetical protein [Sandaracinaceae bacterium]